MNGERNTVLAAAVEESNNLETFFFRPSHSVSILKMY